MSPFSRIRLVVVTTNELREKETTDSSNSNFLKATGKMGQKIGEKPVQLRRSRITTAIELDVENYIVQKMKDAINKQHQYMHWESLVPVASFPRSAGGQKMGNENPNEIGGDKALFLVHVTTNTAHFVGGMMQ
jgi:hypothetical protein